MDRDNKSAAGWKNPHHVAHDRASRIAESLMRGDALRAKVKDGWAFGTFVIELPCVEVLNSVALAGFDFVVLDMEHSALDFCGLEKLIVAGHAAGLAVIVRVWGEGTGLIGKVLDMGANGVMAPHVESRARAEQVVAEARFAPEGGRGFSPLLKYDSLNKPLERLNRATYVILQIEGRKGIENIADIASTPGVDSIFVGPYDLSLSLNLQPGGAEVDAAAAKLADNISDRVSLGIYVDSPSACGEWAKSGFALQCVSFDGRMFANGARAVVRQAQKSLDMK